MKALNTTQTDRLGVQIVGTLLTQSGFVFREQSVADFGVDAHIEYLDGENASGKLIALQIKSGSSWFKEEVDNGFVFRGDAKHLDYWLNHSLPVLIILVDTDTSTSYWQAVTPANVIFTKKAWKLFIPKCQRINAGMIYDLKKLVSKITVPKRYTVSSIDDVSHGSAKRYSLKIILNREHTQIEIIDVVKIATREAENCEYHRSDITRAHWRSIPAHVVWLFIYPSAEDERNNNWICRSEWFSERLPVDMTPISHGGDEVGGGIKVDWCSGYLASARWNAENTIGKEKFIVEVTALVRRTIPLINEAAELFNKFNSNQMSFESWHFGMEKIHPFIDEIYHAGLNIGLSPFECKDLSINFQSFIASAHNILMPFSKFGERMDKKQKALNVLNQMNYYKESLMSFEFELKKVL